MQKLNTFVKQSVVGGLLIISPAVILFLALRWAFNTVAGLVAPIATPIARHIYAPEFVINILVILLILAACFLVGNFATTRSGRWLHDRFEHVMVKLAPGYNLVRDIIHQLFGDSKDSAFRKGDVARVRLFGSDVATEATGIVTSVHHNGWYTLFVPTGPNPTSGMIYHLPPEQVELLKHVKVEEALRTIIACGAGSGELFALNQTRAQQLAEAS